MQQYHYKYPHTYHFDFSPGLQNDDKRQEDYSIFESPGCNIIATLKMDGENCNMYSDKIHARSIDSKDHPSRHYVKGMWGKIKHIIPEGWRICGENIYAKHSIFYEDLESYFQVFSIWDDTNTCLSYDDTLLLCNKLGLLHVPVIYEGSYDKKYLKSIPNLSIMKDQEGFVVRTRGSFKYEDYNKNVAKYVRKNHVQTSEHWLNEIMAPNRLKNNTNDN